MFLLDHPNTLVYITFGLFILFQLARLGSAILTFLRDLDDYQANRLGR
jgi:hypothetical protein